MSDDEDCKAISKMTKKFRKRPIVIEALQLLWSNWNEMCDFADVPNMARGVELHMPKIAMELDTLEGKYVAMEGDWIIKGIRGELYPCKPDIFEQTYDEVTND